MILRTQEPQGYTRSKWGLLVPGVRHRPAAPCYAPGVWAPKQLAFTFVNSGNNSAGSVAGTTLDIAYTTTTGSLLVGWTKHEDAVGAISIARSDGSESWTAGTKISHANGLLHSQFHYLLASTGSGSITYRMTTASRSFRSFILFEYTYTGTASTDGRNEGTGTSNAPSSGNFTTSATDGIAFGGYGEFSTDNGSAQAINGVGADGTVELAGVTFTAAWRKTVTSGFTGAATCSLGSSLEWVCGGLAFKAVAGGDTLMSQILM